jgi:hypothetical protein
LPKFKDSPILEGVEMLQSPNRDNRTNSSSTDGVDSSIENMFGGTQFFFSTVQDPTEESSVYETSEKFACILINRSAPTILVHGGNYAKECKLSVEAILP